jgi:hypothetical protein
MDPETEPILLARVYDKLLVLEAKLDHLEQVAPKVTSILSAEEEVAKARLRFRNGVTDILFSREIRIIITLFFLELVWKVGVLLDVNPPEIIQGVKSIIWP